MLRRLLNLFWYLSASLLVVAALLLSLARLALPMLDVRESQLASWMRATVGHDLRIGELDLAWRGLGPELRVAQVTLSDPQSQQALLTADELRIGIDLWKSLWAWHLQPSSLVLIGSELRLSRDAQGAFSVEGLQLRQTAANPWRVILSQPKVELRSIRVHWRDTLQRIPDGVLDDVNLRMTNRGIRHRLELQLRLPPEIGNSLWLVADLRGPAQRFDQWRGQVYVNVNEAPLARWLNDRMPGDLSASGLLDARLWAQFWDGRIGHVIGTVAITKPRIEEPPAAAGTATASTANVRRSAAATTLFAAQHIAGQIDWRRHARGWTLNLDRMQLTDSHAVWPESGLTVAVLEQPDAGHQVQLGLTYVRLETVAPWLAHVMKASAKHQDLVEKMALGGAVEALQVHFTARAGRINDLAYQLRFKDLHSTAVERIPGSAGLSGQLVGSDVQGVLELDSHSTQLTFPTLFREPLVLDQLRGRVYWRQLADRLRIESAALEATNADIQTQSRLRLDIPLDASQPFLDLQTAFHSGRVEDAYKYFPVGIMPTRTVEWLDRALVSGQVSSGALLFHGRLGDFPFDNATGRMEVRANVADAVLDYKEGWHRIEHLDAELAFINRSMFIQGRAGKILGADVRRVKVAIEDLAHARVDIDGLTQGPLQDMLRFLKESPLAEADGEALAKLQAAGQAEMRLRLVLPLAEHKPAEVQGRVTLKDNRLVLPEWDLKLEQLRGELRFTEQGVTAEGLKAKLMQTPVSLTVRQTRLDEQPATRIQLVGRLPLLQRMQAQAGQFWQRVQGQSLWTVGVLLPRGLDRDGVPHLELSSDLVGTRIDLPDPIGKTPEQTRELSIRSAISHSDTPLHIEYAGHSAALLGQQRDGVYRLQQGTLRLGDTDAQLPDSPGLRITGHLTTFPWDVWRRVFDTASAGQGQLLANLNEIDVQLDQLRAYGRDFHAVHLSAQPQDNAWRIQLTGPDLDGNLLLPSAAEVLKADFTRLRIPSAVDERGFDQLDPAGLPALQANIAQLQFHDLQLGHVTLHTRPLSDGLAVDRLQIDSDWMKLSANGSWTRHDEQDASRFHIELQGGELGRLLSTFGYAGSVEGGPTFGEIEANWPGTPADFALSKLEGNLALRIGPGRLLNVEAGAGRVFGLFSMQGIRRRLALDFSDVFEKGFSFDRIAGHFTLLDSDAYTNDLVIEGPAARIEVSGRTGLVRHDYDQLVTVFPRVQSTLPIAGALAGGPVVGAALLLADRLFSQQMEELTSFAHQQYTVTGSWEDPQFRALEPKSARDLRSHSAPPNTLQQQDR